MKTIKIQISDDTYHMLKIYTKYGHHEKDKLFDDNSLYEFYKWCWNTVDEIQALVSLDKEKLDNAFGSYNAKRLLELLKYLQTDECKEIIRVHNRYNNDKIRS